MKLHRILWEAEKKVGLSKVPLTVDVFEMSRLVSIKPVGFNPCFLSKVGPNYAYKVMLKAVVFHGGADEGWVFWYTAG